jgi:S-adenosylmethionine-dependent methyltransferase
MDQAQYTERGPPTPRIPPEPDGAKAQAAFDAKAQQWDVYSRAPLGRLRCELTLHYLGQHLDGRAAPLIVLDAGAGTGSYALPLAQQGHRVCLLDFSAQMLDVARQNAAALDPAMLERLDFSCASAQEAPSLFGPDRFDLILCHTLLEYVSDPRDLLQALVVTLKPGGLLSLLAVNPHSDALRWALAKGDLGEARQALGQTRSSTTLFGVNRRVYAGPALRALLAELGLQTVATYGVRIFADYMEGDRLADAAFISRLWALERDAGLLAPYAQIARYSLTIAKKTGAN